jgi:hypothetical protein
MSRSVAAIPPERRTPDFKFECKAHLVFTVVVFTPPRVERRRTQDSE